MQEHSRPARGDAGADTAFCAYYAAVEASLQAHPPLAADAAPQAADDAAQRVHRHLRNLIELDDLQAPPGGPGGAAQAQALRYLKAALADELLLSRAWAGQAAWPRLLLETALFGSSVAGDRLLGDIERLLRDREPAQRPLARLYLAALALGFQGRLRGQGDLRALTSLRGQLFQFAYQRAPGLDDAQAVLCPQTGAHTVEHLTPKRRRGISRWSLRWALGLLLLLLVSEGLWFGQTWSLRQALNGSVARAPAVSP